MFGVNEGPLREDFKHSGFIFDDALEAGFLHIVVPGGSRRLKTEQDLSGMKVEGNDPKFQYWLRVTVEFIGKLQNVKGVERIAIEQSWPWGGPDPLATVWPLRSWASFLTR